MPAIGEPDALTIRDAGRDLHLERAPARDGALGRGTRDRAARRSARRRDRRRRPSCASSGRRACAWPPAAVPTPPQRSQVSIGVPGSAPLPWQCSQRSIASKETSRVAPSAASSRSISIATATSAPCSGPERAAERAAAEERVEQVADRAEARRSWGRSRPSAAPRGRSDHTSRVARDRTGSRAPRPPP